MRIEFIAHATFKVVLDDGRVVVIDPYQAMSFGGRFNYPRFCDTCDFAVITHDHLDHNYVGDLGGHPVLVRNSWRDHGLSVESVDAWHDKVQGTKFGGCVRMKVLEADGVRLGHLGDCGEILSDAQIERLGRLDVLLVPVGGFYTIDGDEAAALVARIGARTVIPCHYLTPKCSLKLEDCTRFLEHYDRVPEMSGMVNVGKLPDGVVLLSSRY